MELGKVKGGVRNVKKYKLKNHLKWPKSKSAPRILLSVALGLQTKKHK